MVLRTKQGNSKFSPTQQVVIASILSRVRFAPVCSVYNKIIFTRTGVIILYVSGNFNNSRKLLVNSDNNYFVKVNDDIFLSHFE